MKATRQFIQYCIVGVASNAVAYGVFLLLVWQGVEAKISMSIVYAFGAAFSFWMNRTWTFAFTGNWIGSTARFLGAHLSGYLLNLIILMIFRDRFHFPAAIVQAAAIGLVAIYMFLASKLYVFRERVG
jgi:putative flippase GtrA